MELFLTLIAYLIPSVLTFAACSEISIRLVRANKLKLKNAFWIELVLPVLISACLLAFIVKIS